MIIHDIEEKICIPEEAFFKEHIFLESHKEPYVLSRMMFVIDKLNYIKMFVHPLERTVYHLLKMIALLNGKMVYEEMCVKDLTSYGAMLHAAHAYCCNHYLAGHAGTLSEHVDRVYQIIREKNGDLSYFDMLLFFSKIMGAGAAKWDGYRHFYSDKLLEAGRDGHVGPKIGPYLFDAMYEGGMSALPLARDVLVI